MSVTETSIWGWARRAAWSVIVFKCSG